MSSESNSYLSFKSDWNLLTFFIITFYHQSSIMHDGITRPKGSVEVVVTLKSNMTSGSPSSGGNSKGTGSMIYLKAHLNRPSH